MRYDMEHRLVEIRRLRWRWGGVTAVYLLAIIILYTVLQRAWPYGAPRWAGLTAVTAIYCLWVVWRHLEENHRPDESTLLARFGWGNRLTLLRGLLISLVGGFLLSPWPAGWVGWLPAVLYTAADAADYLDGYAARITNHATQLGTRLDMTFDSLGMVVVTLLAAWYGQLPWWYLPVGLARYLFMFGLWLRQKQQWPISPLPHSWHRRIFAGFQMGFMSVALWPIVPATTATIAGTLFALATAASFLRDWLVAIGWVDPHTAVYQRWQRRLYWATAVLLPLFLRLVFLICLVMVYIRIDMAGWTAVFATWRLPWPETWARFWAMIGVAAGSLIMAGAVGRVMALVMMFPLGFAMLASGANVWNGTAVASAVLIMLLGTGALSLWRPEERFMYRRAGTQ